MNEESRVLKNFNTAYRNLKISLTGHQNPNWLFLSCLVLILLSLFFRFEENEEFSNSAVEISIQPVISEPGETVTISDREKNLKIELNREMEYFFDINNQFPEGFNSSGESALQFDQSFQPADGKTHWGVHSEVCWFRVAISSDLKQDMNFYASNLVDHRLFTLKAGQSVYLYYRLQYNDAGIVCIPSVSNAVIHNKKITGRLIYSSILLGLYIGLFLYNIFLAFSTGEKTYPPYLAGLFFFALYLLFREFPVSFGQWDIASASFTLPAYLCILLFTRNFFHLSEKKRALLLCFYILLFFGILSLYSAIISSSLGTILKYIFSLLLFGYAIGIAKSHYSQNKKTSFFFLLSWGPALVCLIFSLLSGLQIMNFREGSLSAFLGSNPSMYLQIAFQMVSLSIVLGDQINREKKKVIQVSRESEDLRLQDSIQKDFILYISHEIRTTLTLISGSLEGLRKGRFGKIDKTVDLCLGSLQNNEKQLEDYISNLLIFTRISTQKETFKSVPQNIAELLYLLSCNYSSLAEARNINFRISIDRSHPCVIENNSHLFELMINNLLSNAFKFTKEKGEITVGIERIEQKSYCISITNTGLKIPENEQSSIFNKFHRLPSGTEGMGFGLHMVRKCARLLKGRIEVNCAKGITSFFLYFPIAEITSAAPEKLSLSTNKNPSSPIQASEYSGSPVDSDLRVQIPSERLLLVEDNEDLLEMIRLELEREFTVYTAGDGQEALKLIRNGLIPDIIISDILMPNIDGISFFQTIRIQERHNIPFIFLSAIENEQDRRKLYDMGAVDFLNKPFSLPTLTIKVRNLLLWKSQELVRQKEDLKSAVLAVFNNQEISGENPDLEIARKIQQYKLNRREEQTLKGVLKGLQDKEIAAELNLATSTISNYLQKIYRKTGTGGRTSLMYLFSGNKVNSIN